MNVEIQAPVEYAGDLMGDLQPAAAGASPEWN